MSCEKQNIKYNSITSPTSLHNINMIYYSYQVRGTNISVNESSSEYYALASNIFQ
jgi:hypothetical protein